MPKTNRKSCAPLHRIGSITTTVPKFATQVGVSGTAVRKVIRRFGSLQAAAEARAGVAGVDLDEVLTPDGWFYSGQELACERGRPGGASR